jgi:dipeptidyl aminopeptidase/acylaminoacyl peptidase
MDVIDERELVERAVRALVREEPSFDNLIKRRQRKRRNQRIAAGVVGIAVFVAAVWIVTTGLSFDRTQQPAIQPTPTPTAFPGYHHNGEILVLKDGAFTQIDPVTGNVVTGNGVELPLAHPVSDFTWSPDGMDLAYATNCYVQVVDVATGASRLIMNGAAHCSLAWSPDGSRIAVAHDGMIELIDPEGGNRSTLVELVGNIVQPAWSPDGERIAFQVISGYGPGERSLYVVDRDGSNLIDLLGPAHNSIGFFDPAWSPDGSRIAYIASTQAGSTKAGPWRLRVEVVDADGSNPTELVEAGTCYCLGFAPGLTWSPDGASMALNTGSLDDQDYGLYVMNADGTGLRLVAKGTNGSLAWRPVP